MNSTAVDESLSSMNQQFCSRENQLLQRNLIVQFPVFVQPYTQKRLIMYQIETVPVPILDENEQVHSYTELKIEKLYIALNEESYIMLRT